MNQVIAAHGWAGDASIWRTWQRSFEALGWRWQSVEQGYSGQQPYQPCWAADVGQRLLISHSLGVHMLPASVLADAQAIVLLAGFSAFVPPGATGRGQAVALRGMAARLGTPREDEMLQKFLERCAAPLPASALPPNPLLRGITQEGRERLRAHLQLLQNCDSLPSSWPAEASVLVIRGDQDRVVCDESHALLLQQLPSDRSEEHRLDAMGHALVRPEVLKVVLDWIGAG